MVFWILPAALFNYPTLAQDTGILISDVELDYSTFQRLAPGSDNWPITWASNDHQYTSWGDGGGFGGTNSDGRVSLGVARLEGSVSDFEAYNVWGGYNAENPATFAGKSYGILSVGATLYMWVSPGSDTNNYTEARLHTSTNGGASWSPVDWAFVKSENIILPSIMQAGQEYSAAEDDYVYMYAARYQGAGSLEAQAPGIVDMFRVPKGRVTDRSSYQFFAGLSSGSPEWTSDKNDREPVHTNSSVSWAPPSVVYNPALDKYIMVIDYDAQQGSGDWEILQASNPWGPWESVRHFTADWENGYTNFFFFSISPKWISPDGKQMWLIGTGTGPSDAFMLIRMNLTTKGGTTNEPPAVSVIGPTNGATFAAPASVLLEATASDSDGSVTKVEFFEGSTKLGEDTSSPYSYAWQSVAAGTYTLTARATDDDGATTTSAEVSITVEAPENDAPSVSLTAPGEGASYMAPAMVTLEATASDSDGSIAKVEFFEGSTKLGEDTSSPYSYGWLNVAAGSYALSARATDNLGLTASSNFVAISVNATGGDVTIENVEVTSGAVYPVMNSLTNGASIYIDRTYEATAVPALLDGLAYIQTANDDKNASPGSDSFLSFEIDQEAVIYVIHDDRIQRPAWLAGWSDTNTQLVSTDAAYSVFMKTYPAGKVILGSNTEVSCTDCSMYAVAVEDADMGGENIAPSIALTAPGEASVYEEPATIVLEAEARDDDGTIELVEFFANENKVGEVLEAPFTLAWGDVVEGTYSITARATDDRGLTTTSSAVSVTVQKSSTSRENELPKKYVLRQNYPNPFARTTQIVYELAASSKVSLEVYNTLGQLVDVIIDSHQAPGAYQVTFDASNIGPGAYVCKMRAGNFTQSILMVAGR